MEFSYKARNSKNKVETGRVYAMNRMSALTMLKNKGFRAITVKVYKPSIIDSILVSDGKGGYNFRFSSGFKTKDLMIFSKQFSIMLERGIPMLQALELLGTQQNNIEFKKVLEDIKFRVESGASLSDALVHYPKYFNELYLSMVRAGEVSGSLDKTFKEIVGYLERNMKLASQVKSATIYPTIVLSLSVVLVALILTFVVPTFKEQFESSGQQLPALTQMLISTSSFMADNFLYIFGAIIVAILGIIKFKGTKEGKEFFDKLFLKIPVTGRLVSRVAISRFSFTMSTMLGAGVTILDSLGICASSSGNSLICKYILGIKENVSKGQSISIAMRDGIFPPMVVSMVAIGEQTGAIEESLRKIAEIYEEEVDNAVKDLTGLIQPVLIVGIGLIIGFIVIALYLPLFDMGNLV